MKTLTLTDAEAHLLVRAALRGIIGVEQVPSDDIIALALKKRITDFACTLIEEAK